MSYNLRTRSRQPQRCVPRAKSCLPPIELTNLEPPTRIAYRPDIDGLRAVAILVVVFFHAGIGFPGGFVGVDVFFVISGYLITRLILKDLRAGSFSLARFWERRVRRILPALVVVTAATLIAGWFLLLPPAYEDLGKSVTSLVLLVSNVYFSHAGEYFGRAAHEMPLLHTWSLAVEEQFYLLLPLGLVLLAKFKRLNHASIALAALALLSFGAAVYSVNQELDGAFYWLLGRVWELLLGSLLALAPPVRSPLVREGMAMVALPLLLAPVFLYHRSTPFPGLTALPPVLGAVLVIWSGMTDERRPLLNRFLIWRPMVFVGKVSYSLYLWHWPLLALHRAALPGETSPRERVLLIALSFVPAVLSWRFIETPFRSGGLLPKRRALYAAGAITVGALLIAGLAIDKTGGGRDRVPAESRRFLDSGRNDPRYRHKVLPDEIPAGLTVLGAPGDPELLIWGDSHAMSLLAGVEALCKEHGISARAATTSSTAPLLDYPLKHGAVGRKERFNDAVFHYLRSARIRDVALVGRWAGYNRDPKFPGALLDTVKRVTALGSRVYLVSDVPDYRCNVPETLALFAWRGKDPAQIAAYRNNYRRDNGSYLAMLPSLRQAGATILDPATVLEAAGKGLPFDAGGSYYIDEQHLSDHGALAVRAAWAPLFRQIEKIR